MLVTVLWTSWKLVNCLFVFHNWPHLDQLHSLPPSPFLCVCWHSQVAGVFGLCLYCSIYSPTCPPCFTAASRSPPVGTFFFTASHYDLPLSPSSTFGDCDCLLSLHMDGASIPVWARIAVHAGQAWVSTNWKVQLTVNMSRSLLIWSSKLNIFTPWANTALW